MPEITLPGLPAMVQAARRGVRALLEETGCARIDDAELIVSEFASNAVLHSRSAGMDGSFTVLVEAKPGWLRLEVSDAGPAEDQMYQRADDEHRRGLLIVDAVADRWGHRRPAGTRAVFWAELDWEATA
jgi:anti-sigma regulatory factor (Ser/Thr protein kinase)